MPKRLMNVRNYKSGTHPLSFVHITYVNPVHRPRPQVMDITVGGKVNERLYCNKWQVTGTLRYLVLPALHILNREFGLAEGNFFMEKILKAKI